MNRRIVVRVLVGIVIALIAIQLIPVWLLQTNPPVTAEPNWGSPRTRSLMQRSCFDCHSNQTAWPWYSRIAPVSWLVTLDMIRGRRHMNLSEWGTGSAELNKDAGSRAAERIIEVLSNKSMPPSYYMIMHPEAKLSDSEVQQLIQGVTATFK